MHAGLEQCLYLGNLDARRDWGHARDYVQAQWAMLQHSEPEDFVIATGQQHSVREFVDCAARHLGVDLRWEGEGVHEQGIASTVPEGSAIRVGQPIVAIDPRYFRPAEVDTLLGDATKARTKLGWHPVVGFEQLVQEMMDADLHIARRDALVSSAGFRAPNNRE